MQDRQRVRGAPPRWWNYVDVVAPPRKYLTSDGSFTSTIGTRNASLSSTTRLTVNSAVSANSLSERQCQTHDHHRGHGGQGWRVFTGSQQVQVPLPSLPAGWA